MSPATERTLGVLAMVLLALGWIASPGTTLLVIGALIGALAVAAWVARKIGI